MNTSILLAENTSKTCRICFDSDNQTDLIRPCLCRGGSAYVHRKCLDDWRSLNKEDRGFKFCEVCQFQYVIEPVVDDPNADRKRKLIFRLLVTRDITLIILLTQAFIIGLAFLIQVCDGKTKDLRHSFPESMSAFGVYYLVSLTIFFALLGFFGLIGICCGWLDVSERHRTYDDDPCGCNNMQCFFCCYACGDCHGVVIVTVTVIVKVEVVKVFL